MFDLSGQARCCLFPLLMWTETKSVRSNPGRVKMKMMRGMKNLTTMMSPELRSCHTCYVTLLV